METTAHTWEQIMVNEPTAAKMVNLCPKTMFNLRKDKQIPYVKVRNRILYRVSALEEWAKENEQGPKK